MSDAEHGVFATYPSLRGAVAFVSGGASGLGAEFVTQLAAQGARVGFADIQEEAGERLVEAVAAAGVAEAAVPPLRRVRHRRAAAGDRPHRRRARTGHRVGEQRGERSTSTRCGANRAGVGRGDGGERAASLLRRPSGGADDAPRRRWVDHQPRVDQRPHRSAQPPGVHHRQGRHRRPHPDARPANSAVMGSG